MAVSRALRRLLRIVEIQEDQCRLALESAVGELSRIERALVAATEQARSGRNLVINSARSGELPDRLAGLEETRAARQRAKALAPRIADAKLEVAAVREAYLAKRVERRQSETLIEETEFRDAIVSARRIQQSLDDWYLNRLNASRRGPQAKKSAGTSAVSDTSSQTAPAKLE